MYAVIISIVSVIIVTIANNTISRADFIKVKLKKDANSVNINLKPKYTKYGFVFEIENGLKGFFNYIHADEQLFHFNIRRHFHPNF